MPKPPFVESVSPISKPKSKPAKTNKKKRLVVPKLVLVYKEPVNTPILSIILFQLNPLDPSKFVYQSKLNPFMFTGHW